MGQELHLINPTTQGPREPFDLHHQLDPAFAEFVAERDGPAWVSGRTS
jgi:hypothetical protein